MINSRRIWPHSRSGSPRGEQSATSIELKLRSRCYAAANAVKLLPAKPKIVSQILWPVPPYEVLHAATIVFHSAPFAFRDRPDLAGSLEPFLITVFEVGTSVKLWSRLQYSASANNLQLWFRIVPCLVY